MSIHSNVSRRTLLAAGAGGLGATVVAACSSSGSSGADDASAAAGTPATTGGGGSSAASGGATTSAAAGSATGAGTALATLADIKVGEAVSVELPNGKPGIVSRPTATTAACFSAICTHEGCTVKPKNTTLNCPCHGSRFDAKTGAVLNGPASSPLEKVAVRVSSGKVLPA